MWHDKFGAYGLVNEDDSIEINDNLKILVPGIWKWYEEFDNKANYASSCMDSDFNSWDWNKTGLILAQKMRKELPSNIDLWYSHPFEDVKSRNERVVLIYCENYG